MPKNNMSKNNTKNAAPTGVILIFRLHTGQTYAFLLMSDRHFGQLTCVIINSYLFLQFFIFFLK